MGAYVDTLSRTPGDCGGDRDDNHPALGDDDEATAALVIQLDAINFGSGWHPVLRKRSGLSGALTVATAYREHSATAGVPTVDRLTALTAEECAAILDQDLDGDAAELMSLFARALNELGRFVGERFGGSFLGLVESAGGSAAAMIDRLTEMPMYRDVVPYDGREVPLLKRAQITAHDLDRAFGGRGPGRFDDIDRLTMFADNLVPHVLRIDGVLAFDPELVSRIDAGVLLAYGSVEEVEIRAVALHAVELLAAATGRAPRHIDEVLWRRGGGPAYKAVPRHRCRTSAY
jgi:hypothetical protein